MLAQRCVQGWRAGRRGGCAWADGGLCVSGAGCAPTSKCCSHPNCLILHLFATHRAVADARATAEEQRRRRLEAAATKRQSPQKRKQAAKAAVVERVARGEDPLPPPAEGGEEEASPTKAARASPSQRSPQKAPQPPAAASGPGSAAATPSRGAAAGLASPTGGTTKAMRQLRLAFGQAGGMALRQPEDGEQAEPKPSGRRGGRRKSTGGGRQLTLNFGSGGSRGLDSSQQQHEGQQQAQESAQPSQGQGQQAAPQQQQQQQQQQGEQQPQDEQQQPQDEQQQDGQQPQDLGPPRLADLPSEVQASCLLWGACVPAFQLAGTRPWRTALHPAPMHASLTSCSRASLEQADALWSLYVGLCRRHAPEQHAREGLADKACPLAPAKAAEVKRVRAAQHTLHPRQASVAVLERWWLHGSWSAAWRPPRARNLHEPKRHARTAPNPPRNPSPASCRWTSGLRPRSARATAPPTLPPHRSRWGTRAWAAAGRGRGPAQLLPPACSGHARRSGQTRDRRPLFACLAPAARGVGAGAGRDAAHVGH